LAAEPRAARSILVPLDGSRLAERALPLATALARRSGGTVCVALVHRMPAWPSTPDADRLSAMVERAVRQGEHDYLQHIAGRISGALERSACAEILEGETADALVEHAHQTGADLVVMTTHGRGPVQRAWLGSVADRLVRSLDIPVLLVPSPASPADLVIRDVTISRVLVPLDGSPRCEAALEHALAVAGLFDAPIHLVQVVLPAAFEAEPPVGFPSGVDEQLTGIRKSIAQDYLDDVAERLRAQGVEATTTAAVGASVAGTLADFIRTEPTDLVALATHGRSGVPRLVLGSVADKLVRLAVTPVLVCRPH
jgi:nucleotide-binding universal stress UspA family protein